MSDIRKLLDNIKQLDESSAGCSTAGSVASVSMPLGSTQKRVQEGPEASPPVVTEPPKFAAGGGNWGNWQNSVHSNFSKKNKKTKVKEAKQSVSEVSKETIGSYIKKASQDLVDRVSGASFKSGQAGDKYNKSDDTPRETKRKKGIERAVGKLVKEGEDWPNFGSLYSEQLAQKMFELNPEFSTEGKAEEILDAAYPVAVADLGRKRANWEFGYDEDFVSDFLSAYSYLQEHGALDEGWKQNLAALGTAAALGAGGMAAMGGNASASQSGPEIINPHQVVQQIKSGKITSGADLQAALSNARNKNQVWLMLQTAADMQGSSDANGVVKAIANGASMMESITPAQKKVNDDFRKLSNDRLRKHSFTKSELADFERRDKELTARGKEAFKGYKDKLAEDDVVAKKYRADDIVSSRGDSKADVKKALDTLMRVADASGDLKVALKKSKGISARVAKNIAKALAALEDANEYLTKSEGVLEGAMKDIDIGRQDCKEMTSAQFKKAYGMTKAEWREKNKKVLGAK